jgi:hypothetical protein
MAVNLGLDIYVQGGVQTAGIVAKSLVKNSPLKGCSKRNLKSV